MTQMKTTRPKRPKLRPCMNSSISSVTFRSVNMAPIIYPMTQTPMAGAMVFTPSANMRAMAWGVTVFLSFTTITA